MKEEVGGMWYEVSGDEGEKEKGEKDTESRHSALDAESHEIAGLLNLIQYRNDNGVKQGSLYENITLIPNPTTGELIVGIAGQARNDIRSIEVFDVYGRKVSSHHLTPHTSHLLPQTSSSHQKIDISHINSGVYFVKIITNVGETVKKVIKQ